MTSKKQPNESAIAKTTPVNEAVAGKSATTRRTKKSKAAQLAKRDEAPVQQQRQEITPTAVEQPQTRQAERIDSAPSDVYQQTYDAAAGALQKANRDRKQAVADAISDNAEDLLRDADNFCSEAMAAVLGNFAG